jgi:hypothetical protein
MKKNQGEEAHQGKEVEPNNPPMNVYIIKRTKNHMASPKKPM